VERIAEVDKVLNGRAVGVLVGLGIEMVHPSLVTTGV